jgi:hypothetical protein
LEELLDEAKPAARSKRGPAAKWEQQIEQFATLPRARQRFVTQMLDTVLAQMAQALGVDVNMLLGLAEPRRPKKLATNRLERRLMEIEKLDPKAKRQITQLLDSFIEGQKLKQRVGQRSSSREAARV